MTYFEAYLLTRLDVINCFFEIVLALGSFFGFFLLMGYYLNFGKKKSPAIFYVLFVLFFAAGKILIPTTKQAAFIYIAPAIVNNKDIQDSLKKIPELTNLGLQYLGETLKEQKK